MLGGGGTASGDIWSQDYWKSPSAATSKAEAGNSGRLFLDLAPSIIIGRSLRAAELRLRFVVASVKGPLSIGGYVVGNSGVNSGELTSETSTASLSEAA